MQRQMVELLEGWLRHKSDMVNFEAARAICEMKHIQPAQLTKSIAGESFALLPLQRHSGVAISPSTLPVLAQARPQVCRNQNPRCARPHPPSKRRCLQC